MPGGKDIEASEENAKPSVHRWTVGLVGDGGGGFRREGTMNRKVSRDKRDLQRYAPWDKLIQGYHVPLPLRSLRDSVSISHFTPWELPGMKLTALLEYYSTIACHSKPCQSSLPAQAEADHRHATDASPTYPSQASAPLYRKVVVPTGRTRETPKKGWTYLLGLDWTP
ncbi:uncharacterized protein CLUP02_17291 [Colletotrichum lupini]|uniref:Uncharacterized protein n=1 Tax=Colletotrichum lupini TaxID=145971 RepID=A0A9Q8SEV1_9PEZI|nr:uncharacterized protein CLUP02_17291 [Colletotrichum lupini]UQC75783.1 hypothetical protein CLUP02_17291 [Colletotrichum lupini]